eukprot:3168278-Amphidinium_carterae.1
MAPKPSSTCSGRFLNSGAASCLVARPRCLRNCVVTVVGDDPLRRVTRIIRLNLVVDIYGRPECLQISDLTFA